ncbi:MAG TPA: competence/damage-inducible protein A [Dissulfurispiraceae bacterium]|nr:competence/damage-inducible protein A [Dissulfurispiraceae bacterium]
MTPAKTAGIIIIGDEILTGKVHDSNSFFLAGQLWSSGINVCRISVIADNTDDIAREVAFFSERYDHVFTSGGIGPTHDDVTIEGISKAFGVRTVISDVLKGILEARYAPLTPEQIKMAEVPEGAELIADGNLRFPLIRFRNVYIFPGIPQLLVSKYRAVAHRFSGPRKFLTRVYFKELESVLAASLNVIVAAEKEVKIGSYPVLDKQDYSVMVTFESTDRKRLEAAVAMLLEMAPGDKVEKVNE